MSKILLIDARWRGPTGIGRFYKEIFARRPPEWDYVEINGDNLGSPITPLRLARDIFRIPCDGFWTPGFFPPALAKVPSFATIHDLIHMRQYGVLRRAYYGAFMGPLARRCRGVFTVSQYSKEDIIKRLKVPSCNITVVPNAPSGEFSPRCRSQSHLDGFGNYIFYAGNRRSYKNIPRLIRAFLMSDIPRDTVLALSGDADPSLLEIARKAGQEGRIKFCGKIADADMPLWYASALAIAFVSYDEGFGLPVVEGMASGVPVLAAKASAIPEVAGEAALLVNPFCEKSIATGISSIVNSLELRKVLRDRGLARANAFSWETSAQILWNKIRTEIDRPRI